MADLDSPARSFNFAQAGLRQHDYDALIDWLLTRDIQGLDALLIELHAWVQGPRNDNWMTPFEVEIHTWPYLGARFANNDRVVTIAEKLAHATAHVLANTFRVGQAPRILDAQLARLDGRFLWSRSPVPNEGWKELSKDTVGDARRRKHDAWRATPESAARVLQSKREDIAPELLRGGFNAQAMRDQIARIRAAGIEPVYVIMPHYAVNFFGRDGVAELRDEVAILELDIPQENEDLYDFTHWFDWAHMTKPGAVLTTRRIAERVHELAPRKN